MPKEAYRRATPAWAANRSRFGMLLSAIRIYLHEYIDMMSERAAKEIEKEERDAEGKDGHGKV